MEERVAHSLGGYRECVRDFPASGDCGLNPLGDLRLFSKRAALSD